MKSIFKRRSVKGLPSFSSITNEDVIFHIGAPKTGSSAIQKYCLENREKLRELGIYYPKHGLDENGISGGHSALGQALMEDILDKARSILNDYVSEAKANNCTLLLTAESLFYSPDKLAAIVGTLKYKVVAFYREPLEALYSNYNQMIKRHYLTSNISKYCTAQLDGQSTFLTSESHVKWLEIHGRKRMRIVKYCESTFKEVPIQKLFLLILGVCTKKLERDFKFKSNFLNRSYPLSALELKRIFNFVLSDDSKVINSKLDIYLQGLADKDIEAHSIESRVSKDLFARLQKATESTFKRRVEAELVKLEPNATSDRTDAPSLTTVQLNVKMSELLNHLALEEPDLFMMLKNRLIDQLSKKTNQFEVYKLAELFNLDFEAWRDEWFTRDQISRMPSYDKVEFLRDIADLMFRKGCYSDAEAIINVALSIRPHGPIIKEIKAKIDKAISK